MRVNGYEIGPGANLSGVNLSGVNLSGVNLSGANLSGAYLGWVCLRGAILTGTCLDPTAPVPNITDAEIDAAGLEINDDLVYGWRTAQSQHCGDTIYEPGQCYTAPAFSVCRDTPCHPGLYLAGWDWLRGSSYGNCVLVRCYCRRDELVHAGDKWRCKRLWVVAS